VGNVSKMCNKNVFQVKYDLRIVNEFHLKLEEGRGFIRLS